MVRDEHLEEIIARVEKQKKQLMELDKLDCDEETKFELFKKIISEDEDEFSEQRKFERYLYLVISLIEEKLSPESSFYVVKDKSFNNIRNGCDFFDWLISSGFKPSKEVNKPIYKEKLSGVANYLYVNTEKRLLVLAIHDIEYLSDVDSQAITIEEFKAIYASGEKN